MSDDATTREQLAALLADQPLAVLATKGSAGPHASLVAFAATDDLRRVLFATSRETRKFANLVGDPRVALLVDSRSNEESDFENAAATTIAGHAEEVAEGDRPALLPVYLSKHPSLADFVTSPTCALLCVHVDAYHVVTQFQNVIEWRP